MAADNDGEELEAQGVQLHRNQWRWLDERAKANFTRSRAAELRRLVAAAMQAEQKETVTA